MTTDIFIIDEAIDFQANLLIKSKDDKQLAKLVEVVNAICERNPCYVYVYKVKQ